MSERGTAPRTGSHQHPPKENVTMSAANELATAQKCAEDHTGRF
ncbi:hypothetical protein [Streptomyces canus]|nr:hypothetical protein [Streptomyces canus]